MAALQCVSVCSHFVKDLAHVKYGSQTTPSRKRFDHYVVDMLNNDIDQRLDQLLFTATYVVDNDTRCSWA